MDTAQWGAGVERCPCISHEFFRSASADPDKIAVIHARGGLRMCRELREASHRRRDPASVDEERLWESYREREFPPVYNGDVCFSFGEVLAAVESFSCRIRRVLDGGDDPCLVRPKGYFNHMRDPENQIPESKGGPRRVPQIVGVHIAPSVEYIVAVLSILRCGEAFLPLDPSWPRERLLSIAACSRTELIIRCEAASCTDLNQQHNEAIWTADAHKFPVLYFSMRNDTTQTLASVLDWPCETQSPRFFCYLMYTSGSTGKPKGVCGTEIGLVNRFWWMQQLYPSCGDDILLFKTSISFVDHLQEFLAAILSATPLIVPPFNDLKADPFYLIDILEVYYISRLVTVPSLARVVLRPFNRGSQWAHIQQTLRLLVLSGEVLQLSLCDSLHKLLPRTILLNLYGSTEVSGDCMYFNCSSLPKILETETLNSVPIGLPISNCNINLLGQGEPAEGEICVGGSCLFVGYFDDLSCKDLSKDHSPFYFKTGDYAKRLQCGNLLFIGRKDRTIKINGQLVALEEIEDALRNHPEVIDAAVISESDGETIGHFYLKAYIVLAENGQIQDKPSFNKKRTDKLLVMSIRNWLVRKLPLFMVPNHYFFIQSLPRTSSGKVNYSLLANSSTITEYQMKEPDDGNQCSKDQLQIIKQAFCDALLIEEIQDHDDFFSLGGSSITAALLSHKLGIDMRLIYNFPSPVHLLDALADWKGSHETAFLPSDDHKAKKQKLDNSAKEVSAVQSNALVNSGDSLHRIRSFRQLDYVKFSNYKTAVSGDHSLRLSMLKLPKLCSFSRCNNVVHEGGRIVDDTKKYCLTIGTPRRKTWELKEIWKVPLESCVDASPLVVLKNDEFFLFIGSHSHMFLCVNVLSGCIQWKTCLEDRIECSAATTSDFSHVVVGCYKGKIYFLDFMSGAISWTFQTHGEVKMQPVAWKSLVWCGSHDHWLYALDYVKQCCVYKIPCGGSPYGSPSVDMVRNMIYVASTSGRVTAISVERTPFTVAWSYEFDTPIFGSLSLDSHTGNVICCLVDGRIIALKPKGSLAWEVVTGGPVFAGACMSLSLPSQVLVCSQNGSVYSFESKSGDLVWEYQVGGPITSSAYVDEHIQFISESSHVIHRLVCVCCSSGSIRVVMIQSDAGLHAHQHSQDAMDNTLVKEVARLDLPGDIFSSPVMVGGLIFVGCRDDHVRCISIVPDEISNDTVSV